MPTKQEDLARRMLGWGLAAPLVHARDLGRDLMLARRPSTGKLDLACVVGNANLGQDLAFALTTARGADPFATEFGFDGLVAFVEETSPILIRDRLRASVAKAVAEDPRVRAVTAVEVGDANVLERSLELVVSIETIAGTSSSITTRG